MTSNIVDPPAIVIEAVDKKMVEKVCSVWKSLSSDIDQKTRTIVEMMCSSEDNTRRAMVEGMIGCGLRPEWAKRMEACAITGVIDAVHLYAPKKVIGHQAIISSGVRNLRKIATPSHEFSVLGDDASVTMTQAKDLTYTQARGVWNPHVGEVSLKEQRSVKKAKFDAEKAAKSSPVWVIHSATPRADATGRKLLELHLCLEGTHEDAEVRTLPVSQLRKLITVKP